MTNLWEFLTGRMMQRFVISAIIVWICYRMGHDADSYLPWVIVALTWLMEYLAYTEGVYTGAKGFDKLPESTKQQARKLWAEDNNE